MKDLVGQNGAVVSASSCAAQAGAEILRRGGNAVDAAVAAALAECVVQPANVGIGGYGGAAVFYSAKDEAAIALDFDGRAPGAATPDMFAGKPEDAHRGYRVVVAPPILRGLNALLENHGTMDFADVATDAQKLAEGFTATKFFASSLATLVTGADEDSSRAIVPDGVAPEEGQVFAQQDLADLIAMLRREGPEVFYSGDIPRAIASAVRRHGGILDEADFDAVQPVFGEPLSVESGDFEVFSPCPPSGGLTSLQILNVMNLADADMTEIERYRLFIEAARHAWADRFESFGDPAFVDIPMAKLLSEEHAKATFARIKDGKTAGFQGTDAPGGEHTVHLVAMDKQGNAVSLTITHGEWLGSYVAIPGLGLLLGNGMSRFDTEPGRPNSIAPGKRMQHNMSPLLITRGGRPYCVTGLPGGRKIVNVAALMAYAVTRLGSTCGEAMEMPRFHVEGPEEALVTREELVAGLKAERGENYPVKFAEKIGGPVAGIVKGLENGSMLAASEHGPDRVAVCE